MRLDNESKSAWPTKENANFENPFKERVKRKSTLDFKSVIKTSAIILLYIFAIVGVLLVAAILVFGFMFLPRILLGPSALRM